MKITVYMMFLLGLAFSAQAVLVDDFEDYSTGIISQVTDGKWVPVFGGAGTDPGADSAVRQIAVDPTDPLNQVIYVETNNTGQYGMYGVFPADAYLTDNATNTFYTRFYVTTTALDQSFGLTSIDTPTSGGFGNFNCQVALVRGNLLVRNGGSSATVGTFAANTWYYLWIVVNNTANTYSVYVKTTPEEATTADRVAQDFAFRTGTADGDLDRFYTIANYGANITAGTRLHWDDMEVSVGEDLSVPAKTKPYGPSVEQGTPVGLNIPTTLKWKAGLDPEGIYAVNPNIVDQYVFLSSGKVTDPNLRYAGATGIDPGTTDPNSEYSFTGALDRTYYWAVVEAIDGYAHNGIDNPALTPGVSMLSSIDPNNIIGPVWSYESTRSLPSITQQPADVRAFITDSSAAFTVQFTSLVNPVTATWYKDDAELTAVGDLSIDTDPFAFSTLTIASPALEDEGKYYCVLSVEEGTEDDLQSASRLLIIKQMLARYTFDNPEDRLADTGELAAEVGVTRNAAQGKSVSGLTEPNEVLASNVTLTYVAGIEGDAAYLDGTQYIDLDPKGYPNAGPLNTIGDIRGGGYEKRGFGRGMDQGSILCWVKLESDGAVTMNANIADGTHYGVTTNGTTSARIIVRGENWDGGWQNLGEANGAYPMSEFNLQDGNWHMFAATWNDSTARIYINGEQVATNSQGYTETYFPWDLSNLVGASRSGQPNRHLLNPNDFVTGAIDSLRIYNYVLSADEIAVEYMNTNELGLSPCANHSFVGSQYNFDNTVQSYCKIDLADFAIFARNWLDCGLYPDCRD